MEVNYKANNFALNKKKRMNKQWMEEIALAEKCTRLNARTAERKQKFPLSLTAQDRYIAETATKTTRNQDEMTIR
jgi:hypothetical protein